MKKFIVYRHFDIAGTLLYVGRSVNVLSRTQSHRNSKWFDLIDTIKLEHFATDEEMRKAEDVAIRSEKPIYNVGIMGMHTDGPLRHPSQNKYAILRRLNKTQEIL